MRTSSSLARKRDSRDTIQHAESQYSPSGAVVIPNGIRRRPSGFQNWHTSKY
nr:MAG TPA: hypothetical protein [Bacteriophage sp.]